MRTFIICLSAMVALSVHATQFRGGDNLVVRSDEVIEDDLFAGAQRLTILGTVDGDLIAGGKNIDVDGEVWGDMIAGAEIISIAGRIDDDIRVAAREIVNSGSVGSNALCFCQNLRLTGQSQIGRDLTVYAGEALIEGDIGGRLSGATSSMRIAGRISGDVEISTGSLLILPSAEIMGDLMYTSSKPAEILEGSQVRGQVVHRVKEKVPIECRVSRFHQLGRILHWLKWIFRIVHFVALLIVGLIFVALATALSKDTADTIKNSPWRCLGLGLLALIVVPLAVFIVSLTGVGIPLGIIAIFLYLIFLYLSSIVFAIFIGRSLFRLFGGEISSYLALIIGIVCLFFLGLIPYAGWVIHFVVILFGFGAILLTVHRKRKELRKKEVV